MVDSQCRCCAAPLMSGAGELRTGEGVRGMGGGTSSCTLRVSGVRAERERSAASSMCVVDDGADPYFSLHSAVVCVVEVGCFVHDPTGCLAVAGLMLAVPAVVEGAAPFDLAVPVFGVDVADDVYPAPN